MTETRMKSEWLFIQGMLAITSASPQWWVLVGLHRSKELLCVLFFFWVKINYVIWVYFSLLQERSLNYCSSISYWDCHLSQPTAWRFTLSNIAAAAAWWFRTDHQVAQGLCFLIHIKESYIMIIVKMRHSCSFTKWASSTQVTLSTQIDGGKWPSAQQLIDHDKNHLNRFLLTYARSVLIFWLMKFGYILQVHLQTYML